MFRRLGYVVSGDGTEFTAERKWRTVRVTTLCAEDVQRPIDVVDDRPADAGLQCFVTWRECAAELREWLGDQTLPYEWAVIGVDDDGDHEVVDVPAA